MLSMFPRVYKKIGKTNLPGLRQYNTFTLLNVHKYLLKNKENIFVEKNESGFFRIKIEDMMVTNILTDDKGGPLSKDEISKIKSVRLNFWQLGNTGHSLGDASIHCHPRFFKSYIIQGGYKALNYKEVSLSDEEGNNYFKFELNKAKSSVVFLGQYKLKKTEDVNPKEGDTVVIKDSEIHRVKEYNSTGKSTLTFNTVYKDGKGINHIYMGQKQREAVKLTRENLSPKESKEIIEDVLEIIDNKTAKLQKNKS